MLWRGSNLVFKEDFAAAMTCLKTTDEAEVFKRTFQQNYGPHSNSVLGYLTGDVHPDQRPRVCRILDVQHPIIFDGKSTGEMIAIGAALQKRMPPWFIVAMEIPRRSTKLTFDKVYMPFYEEVDKYD